MGKLADYATSIFTDSIEQGYDFDDTIVKIEQIVEDPDIELIKSEPFDDYKTQEPMVVETYKDKTDPDGPAMHVFRSKKWNGRPKNVTIQGGPDEISFGHRDGKTCYLTTFDLDI